MNDLIIKLKKLKLPKKNLTLIILSVAAVIALSIGELTGGGKEPVSAENTAEFSARYVSETEKQLESILRSIDGAGRVTVMITLESCYENVYAIKESYVEERDDASSKKESEEEYILVKNGSSNEECLLVKVFEPQIKGVAVVAEGADSSSVKNAITQTVCALFNISSAKVSVEKMEK